MPWCRSVIRSPTLKQAPRWRPDTDGWRHIVRVPGLASLVLDRVKRGGLVAVNDLLACHGMGQVLQPDLLRYLE
jgi:hypothetical protein